MRYSGECPKCGFPYAFVRCPVGLNAATYALTGRVVENPNATPKLHTVLDSVCHAVHAVH